jgi:glycosyltransferase involved in cell wall biosynthesis
LHSVVRDGLQHGVGAEGRYQIVRSGIDIEAFMHAKRDCNRAALRRELGIKDGVLVAGSVCILAPAKAPLDLVEVARRVLARRQDVVFLVAGDGPLVGSMRSAVHRYGIAEQFRLLGLREDVADLMAIMDVFVLSSRWEGFPRVLVEAAAMSVPIVATDVGDVAEFLRRTSAGRSVRPGDVDGLAREVLAVLDDSSSHRTRAELSRRLDEYSLPCVVSNHVEVYEKLLRQRMALPA